MSILQKHPVQDLSEWLEIATKELVAPVKERILLEIEAHYAEAVAAHLMEGLSEANAAREALAELGNAEVAAKRFRKQHLTVLDAGRVEQALKRAGSWWRLLGDYLLFFLVGPQGLLACAYIFYGKPFFHYMVHDFFGRFYYQNLVALAGSFFTFAIFPTVSFVMVRRKCKNIGIIYLTRIAVFVCWGGFCFYLMFGFGSIFRFMFVVSYLVLTFLLCIFLPNLRIWFKLLHVANVWDEIYLRNE